MATQVLGNELWEAVTLARATIDPKADRPILTGVSISADEKGVWVAGSNGFAISVYNPRFVEHAGDKLDIVADLKVLRETIDRLQLANRPEIVSLEEKNDALIVRDGGRTHAVPLVRGNYPTYVQLLEWDESDSVGAATLSARSLTDLLYPLRGTNQPIVLNADGDWLRMAHAKHGHAVASSVPAMQVSGDQLLSVNGSRLKLIATRLRDLEARQHIRLSWLRTDSESASRLRITPVAHTRWELLVMGLYDRYSKYTPYRDYVTAVFGDEAVIQSRYLGQAPSDA